MSTQLPYSLQVLQALSTPMIALLAAVIGVMQWRTAHQRAVLDLFQKRWEAYTEIRNAMGEVMREGTAPTTVILRPLPRPHNDARQHARARGPLTIGDV